MHACCLRVESEGVENGSVKRVAQVGSPVVKWAFSSSSSLDSKAQERNHGEASMLDLSELKGGLFLRVSSKAQWVEEWSTWVKPFFWVKLAVPLEFDVSNHKNLNPDQCCNGEWEWLP